MTNDPATGLPGPFEPERPPTVPSPQPGPRGRDFEARAYLRDYTAMMAALPFPSLIVDGHWDVAATNPAYDSLFGHVRPHPTAMPSRNFLRFVLFHPDASTVLGEHETSWCLPLLAQFSSALARHGEDPTLREIRRLIAADPLMDAAYQQGLPEWMRFVGRGALDHDGAVRPVHHPDPDWGRTTCRVVNETTTTLADLGLTRLTLVLHKRSKPSPGPSARTDAAARKARGGRGLRGERGSGSAGHLRVVPIDPQA